MKSFQNRLASRYVIGMSVWVPDSAARTWTEATVESLGIAFVSVVVKMPEYKRLFQFRPEQVIARNPKLKGADRPEWKAE